MKTGLRFSAALAAALLAAPVARAGAPAWGQAFASPLPAAGAEGSPGPAIMADTVQFAEGTRAINEGRWSDAVTVFAKIAEQKGDHTDGALYWEAYAENKLGLARDALNTCATLRAGYPKSTWLDECGALEIEIQSKSGKPVQPRREHSDDLKLLALNSLMQRNAVEARAQLEDIVNDEDASARLKDGARFLLGQNHTGIAYPEIVRISYLEGDVRIERGGQAEKATGAEWQQAVADLPIESGFNLVTGNGRAEIELEDASTFYVGENSVVSFNDLHATDGVPYTEVALLSGTVSLHVCPYVPGELFILKTPADDDFASSFSNHMFMRVTSYTDATAVTPLDGGVLRLAWAAQQVASGQTLYFRGMHQVDPATSADLSAYSEWDKVLPDAAPAPDATNADAQPFAAWDKWVADRVAHRSAAINDVMKAAGLTSPIPGLEGMEGAGKFFDCAPYGKCWEPNAVADDEQSSNRVPDAQPRLQNASLRLARAAGSPQLLRASFSMQSAGPAQAGQPSPLHRILDEEMFPCYPDTIRFRMTGYAGQAQGVGLDPYMYRWAVCHSGYWIHRRRHYTWVVGKRHHHPPIHWIKSGRTLAFVPIHPRDTKGQIPVNAKNEVFAVHNKNGISIERVELPPNQRIEALNEPPREFRAAAFQPLERAGEPRIEAHAVKDVFARNATIAKTAGTPITFDHKSGSFMMPHQVSVGGRNVTVNAPISNRGGDLQGHGGFNGSHSGGSFSGGASHGGSSASSSGGGSHGGGGGTVSSSSSSSSSGSSSGGSAGGGGSHH
jgi:hypothetical protein